MDKSLYERLGGEDKVRAIVADFVGRMVADVLIGFFFVRVDRARLEALEFAHAARALGAPVAYAGRPLAAVHRRLPIRAGHFDRRRQILRETLAAHAVPAALAQPWLAHMEALRGEIVTAH